MKEGFPTPPQVPESGAPSQKRETRIEFDGLEIDGAKLSDMLATLHGIAETRPETMSKELVDHAKREISQLGRRDIITLLNDSMPERWEKDPHLYQALYERLRESDQP